ncbi:MAG: tryptophan 2,3-dioxygenase family protein [Pseudomonadota bacterium]
MSIKMTIEDGVETFEAEIDGETIQWDHGLSYARHIQTDVLLKSQISVSDKPDEMLFIIMHQTMELWIKLALHEANIAMERLRADELGKAEKTLDRIATVLRHMIQSWEVLATLSPYDFMTFRGFLRKASGFQSQQYRALEFCLGLKRPDLVLIHNDDAEKREELERVLHAPSLYDQLLQLLARRGFNIPPGKLDRDFSQTYEPCDAVEDAWLQIYTNPDQHWDLYSLAEKVTGVEYYFQEWRFKHMKTVSRVIGRKAGTGGSSGVNYLVKALELPFFPELWAMRTRMTAPKEGGSYAQDEEACPYGQ